jgi:hypothetical protein
MSWARVNDSLYRDPKQLRMSDAAFRIHVCALSFCVQDPNPTGYLTIEQARALAGALGKRPAVIRELVDIDAWEEREGGYGIRDFLQQVQPGSRDRMRRLRARQRHGDEDVTSQVTGRNRHRDGDSRSAAPPPLFPPHTPPYIPPPDLSPSQGLKSLTAPQGAPALVVVGSETDQPVTSGYPSGYGEFISALNRATGRRFRGDGESARLFRRRLREGRLVEELVSAARGVGLSKHHMGLNEGGIPYNGPSNVLRSKVLDQLIALGRGEIGVVRQETAQERQRRELEEWAHRRQAGSA